MSEKEDTHNEDLQRYLDKIKELKEWRLNTDDRETILYLDLAIEKQLDEMRKLINKRHNL